MLCHIFFPDRCPLNVHWERLELRHYDTGGVAREKDNSADEWQEVADENKVAVNDTGKNKMKDGREILNAEADTKLSSAIGALARGYAISEQALHAMDRLIENEGATVGFSVSQRSKNITCSS